MTDVRILHVIDSLAVGGKERQFIELLKGLNAEPGFIPEAVIMSDDVEYDDFLRLGIRSHAVVRKSRHDLTVLPRLNAVIRQFSPDIVHSWNSMCSIYSAPLAKLHGARFVEGYVRSAPPNLSLRNPDYLRGKLTSPFSDVVVSNSTAGLRAYRIPHRKGVCIHNGFDPRRLSGTASPGDVRRSLAIETGHVVGMVASFSDRKDYDTFLRAAQSILAVRDDVTFLGIGDGRNLARLAEGVLPGQRDRIKLVGRRSDVEDIVDIFSVGVLTSNAAIHGEGISNAIMEYMARGKPVVATDCGGNREIVDDGRTGFLIGNGDAAALARRIIQLLDDRALASACGESGRLRICEEFSMDRMTQAYVQLYKGLLT
jgi:glycosyltransferase involved in cell wall biosynthesis